MTRFELFITQLIDCLQNPGNKNKFVETFKKDDNCLTYFRFRKICEEIGFKPDPRFEWLYHDF